MVSSAHRDGMTSNEISNASGDFDDTVIDFVYDVHDPNIVGPSRGAV
jgi:hypothetical protein